MEHHGCLVIGAGARLFERKSAAQPTKPVNIFMSVLAKPPRNCNRSRASRLSAFNFQPTISEAKRSLMMVPMGLDMGRAPMEMGC